MFEFLKGKKRYIALVLVLIVVFGGFYGYTKIKGFCLEDETIYGYVSQEVKVYKDEYGVYHVFAKNDRDLYFVMGYVVASDRLWQMDLIRRAASGRISELFGKDFLEYDYLIQTMGLRRAAERTVLPDEERKIAEAYAEGVNKYIEDHRNELPPEFVILGYEPEPWTVTDVLLIGKYMAWDLSRNMKDELFRAEISKKFGAEAVDTLLPPYPENAPVIVEDTGLEFSDLRKALKQDGVVRELLGFSGELGSNNWVVGPEKSETGYPMLANDPHLGLSLPSVWYEIHLSSPNLNVIGVTLPGVPVVVIGHNQYLGWGMTNVGADVQDLFIEKVDFSKKKYFYKGEWRNLEVVKTKIKVKGGNEIEKEIYYTANGPIVSQEEDVLSLKWTALENTNEIGALLRLNRAKNFEEFKEGLKLFSVPAQNIVYADIYGNIAYWMTGRIPIRSKGYGLVPHEGWSGEYEWISYIPFEELPHLVNPKKQFIATSNNLVIRDYPYHIFYNYAPPYRAQRITELLEKDSSISVEDMKMIQKDTYSYAAEFFKKFIIASYNEEKPEDLKEYVEILEKWDNFAKTESKGAALFYVFYSKLAENIYKDELQELYEEYVEIPYYVAMSMMNVVEKDLDWIDDKTTPERESRSKIILKSLRDAVEYLNKNYSDWNWGKLHTITFSHPLGAVKPLNYVFNVGPFPVDGSIDTVNAASYNPKNPFKVTSGVSLRMIVDFSNVNNAIFVISLGQCGNRFCSHYKDLVSLWLTNKYQKMLFTEEDIKERAESVITFLP